MGIANISLVNDDINLIQEWGGNTPVFGVGNTPDLKNAGLGELGHIIGPFEIEITGDKLTPRVYMHWPDSNQAQAYKYGYPYGIPPAVKEGQEVILRCSAGKGEIEYKAIYPLGQLVPFPPFKFRIEVLDSAAK